MNLNHTHHIQNIIINNHKKTTNMVLNEEQKKGFEEAARQLMKWMAENLHPHTKAIVDSTNAELLEGSMGFQTDEYIPD